MRTDSAIRQPLNGTLLLDPETHQYRAWCGAFHLTIVPLGMITSIRNSLQRASNRLKISTAFNGLRRDMIRGHSTLFTG
jgi:hypothetical protein